MDRKVKASGRAENKGDVSHTAALGPSRRVETADVHREVNKDNYA